MLHMSSTTIIAIAFILVAVVVVIGLALILADVISPLIQNVLHGESLRDHLSDVYAHFRRRGQEDDDDEEDNSDDLEHSTAILLSMIQAVPVVVDKDDEVVRANPEAYRLGVVDDDTIVEPTIAQAVRNIREQGGRATFDITTMTPQRFAPEVGADDDVQTQAIAISRPNWLRVTVGRISTQLVVVLLDDMSEQVRFTQIRDAFITNVSEQILKPDATLHQLADDLERGGLTQEQINEDVRNIRSTVAYIDHMVKDLLLLIKAQEQVKPTEINRLNIYAEAEAAVKASMPLAAERGQRITLSGDNSLRVHGDSEQIRSAITKLIENALEYSPDNAVVSVNVQRAVQSDDAVIRVIDRGAGIPREEQQRIFERFYRGTNQNEYTAEGVGLGLAIVKHVALTHHGSVHLWSKPGEGSTFTLMLPLAKEK